MFYYSFVLNRHSGCFSTIWLAATKGIKVNRREVLRVNVQQTCSDIFNYVTAQVSAPQPNQPKPRFSLYLSSQLQYGVIVVYHRQCGFLLEELQQTIDRLLRFKSCIHIDIPEAQRMALDVPDHLNLMDEAERAQDPFFGLMVSDQLPSPYKMHLDVSVTEELSLVSTSQNTPDEKSFRSHPADITLAEKDQVVVDPAEHFEVVDLPEPTATDIDFLMNQPDLFPEGEEQQVEERTSETEGARSFSGLLHTMTSGMELDELVEFPEGAAPPEVTPARATLPAPPSRASRDDRDGTSGSSSGELPASKPTTGRRRQLVFADREVQISERKMKEQLENSLAETLLLSDVLMDIWTKLSTPAQLFSAPCGSPLHEDLLTLWKASISVLHNQEQGQWEEEEEEEEEHDKELLRAARKRMRSGMREMSSESELHSTKSSSLLDVILDVSKEDKSAGNVITPINRWSLQDDAQTLMEPIVEEMIELPEAQTDDRETLSFITSLLHRSAEVSFSSMLPPQADRLTVAHTLSTLLGLLSVGRVTVRQSEPYHDITVELKAAESL